MQNTLKAKLTKLRAAQLYLVCGANIGTTITEQVDEHSNDKGVVAAALQGGVNIVQLREKEAPVEELAHLAHTLRKLCHQHGALFIVNDQPGLAVAWQADGVHIGQDDMPVAEARAIVGPERLIGLSTHSPAQIEAALQLHKDPLTRLDYIGVGPVYETPTKPGRSAVGLELVRYAATHATLPWFAIGGIDTENIGPVTDAGAQRVAVVRAITDSSSPKNAVQQLMSVLT